MAEIDWAIGRKARVHLHLPTGRYSFKVGSLPVFYADAVTLRDAVFHVDRRLRQRFEEHPSRRTVHAHVVGLVESFDVSGAATEPVSCSPFRYRGFAARDMHRAISAERVELTPQGKIFASGLVFDPDSDIRCAIPNPKER